YEVKAGIQSTGGAPKVNGDDNNAVG
ncbi:TPA: phage holin, partial [Staphylococcus aureus]|nr:phage holin [Staphylococcus aureus]HCV6341790.1 phage holin [Staphylococcus aureus]HDC6181888.1 phage holin [Staphylococcus aureus]HDC6183320.1 phage holin [Staphylococcus aureus]